MSVGQIGKIAFVSQPGAKFAVSIEQINQVALAGEAGNTFLARASSDQQSANWWRPGMSGIAKIDSGLSIQKAHHADPPVVASGSSSFSSS